jgi:hypothetical protein
VECSSNRLQANGRYVSFGSRLCENSDVELSRRTFVSMTSNKKRTILAGAIKRRKERKQFCAFSARGRFHTAWVKIRNSHLGQMFSALRPKADSSQTSRHNCFVPNSEVATTRLPVSNWSSARSYLCNGDAGDREQPTDNQLWGHTVAKEQHARNQGEHRKQQAWCDAAHGTTGDQPEPRRRSRSHGLRSGIHCSSRPPLQLVRYCAVSRPGRSTAAR